MSGKDWVYATYAAVMAGLDIWVVVMIAQVIRDYCRDRKRMR